MLFILAIDILDRVIRKAAVGILQPTGLEAVKFHCSFCADDVILLASPTTQEAKFSIIPVTSNVRHIYGTLNAV